MVTIRVLEQRSPKRLTVSWREPARCNYTEQSWALCKALQPGTCVLSGESIDCGDSVYTPLGRPINRGSYIRPAALPPGLVA